MTENDTINQQQVIKEQKQKNKKKEANAQIKKNVKKKVIFKVLLSFSGCSLPVLCIFVIFVIIYLLVFNDAGIITLEAKSGSNEGNGECGFTISETSLSQNEFSKKLSTFASGNSAFKIFADNASGIYEYAESKKINPELVVIRAYLESGGTAIPAPYNYWGMGCTNTGGAAACISYNSFQEGYEKYIDNISQYNSIKEMMQSYAFVGTYWYNPGGSDIGGCYYAEYIYDSDMPARVKNACSSSAAICTGGESSCVPTTYEDQDAYSTWQVKRMAEVRKTIFGLEQSDGPCNSSLREYNLNRNGLKTLESPLTESQIKDLNEYVKNEVDKAGYGTGTGVAAAGQSLVYWLEKQGVYLNYYWGGGHSDDSTLIGGNTKWGKNVGSNTYNPNQHYGMDCSGFVSWAIRNGCNPGYGSKTTYYMDHGSHVNINDAKPGDIMLNPQSHVRLVVKNNGDGSVITAEETAGNNDWGLIFTRKTEESGYFFVDMSNYYKSNCTKR